MTTDYPRDMIGYGAHPPHPHWPGDARIAVQFVINYEEGGENNILHGDAASEIFLSEIIGAAPFEGRRHMSMESIYEYGSRVGIWRLLRLFEERKLVTTIFAVGMALERHPEAACAMVQLGHEIASHGWRWINYDQVSEAVERADLSRAIESLQRITGTRPLGWYTGRTSERTQRIVAEEGGFLYDADSYADDLPYWVEAAGQPHLIVPYTLDTNDMRFATAQGFNTADHFFAYLRDSFDTLYEEGATQPKMMSVGLHCRLAGRPARIAGLKRFLDYIGGFERVWVCRRIDIARHWRERFPKEECSFL